jgi:hypothetical protein
MTAPLVRRLLIDLETPFARRWLKDNAAAYAMTSSA